MQNICDGLDGRVVKTEQLCDFHNEKLDNHENRVGKLETELTRVDQRVHDIDKKIMAMKKSGNDQLENSMNSKFEELKKLFATVQDLNVLKERVDGVEKTSIEHN